MSKQCYYCDAPAEEDSEACFRHMKFCCCKCGKAAVPERFSLGIYAGHYCDKCWEKSGYRKEGPEGFDYLDAGESYEDDY